MNDPITSEIFQVGGPFLTSPDDAAIYLICSDGAAALVDAGCGTDVTPLMENIRSCGVMPNQIQYLLMTHCHIDHTGGARTLRDLLGCKTVAHHLEADYIEQGDNMVTAAHWYGKRADPCPVDLRLDQPTQALHLGNHEISAIHTPGHSPGSVVFLVESDNQQVLFAQDVHGPLHPILKSDQNAYVASLKRILALEADILCEGHFGIYRGKAEVHRFVESFL